MKKLILASLAILFTAGSSLEAFLFRRNNCCAAPCARVSRATCEAPCEPTPPTCCKRIKVPVTVMEERIVNVPARKIVTPVADVIERIPQPAREIRTPQPPIPQPDLITYQCVPDKIVRHPQPPCVRFECPTDCETM